MENGSFVWFVEQLIFNVFLLLFIVATGRCPGGMIESSQDGTRAYGGDC